MVTRIKSPMATVEARLTSAADQAGVVAASERAEVGEERIVGGEIVWDGGDVGSGGGGGGGGGAGQGEGRGHGRA